MLYSLNLAKKGTYHSDYLDEDIVDLLGGTFHQPAEYEARLLNVDSEYVGRIDLASDDLYMDDIYADVLYKLNPIGNPFEFNEYMNIVVPTQDYLESFVVQPAKEWDESAEKQRAVLPKAKPRASKRKPNEAVIGDKRFNIDPLSRIIIY